MPVLYGDYSLRPVQSVDLTRDKQSLGDGRAINTTLRAVVKGTILPDVPDGTFTPVDESAKLTVILAKQKEIRDAFAVDGEVFEVQGWDGGVPVKFQARVVSVDFPEGLWFNKSEYVIVLESAEFSGEQDSNYHVTEADESWSVSSDSYPNKVTHTVSAKGALVYDATGALPKLPWEYARDFAVAQLGLGFTAVGSTFSPASGQTLVTGAQGQPLSHVAWNRTVTEEIHETDGTYSATESWVLFDSNYFEDTAVEVRRVDDQPNLMVVVGVSGTITGHAAAINDFATRYANAQAAWATVSGTLMTRANAAAGITLNTHFTAYEVQGHPQEGSLTYRVEFNNRTLTNDTWETYEVSKKRAVEDYKTTVTIEGKIIGVAYLDTDNDPSVRFTRAAARWATVKGLIFARAVSTSGLTDLKPNPVNATVSEDPALGTVSYSYDFDNRPFLTARLEYSVSRRYSREDARTTVTVEGKVTGIVTDPGVDYFEAGDINARFNNALSYWNGIEPNVLGMAALYVNTADISPDAWGKTVANNPLEGTVTFTYEFNSQLRCFPFALSEVLSVTDTDAIPVIAEIPIPGRAAGPIIQDMATVSAKTRTFSVELILPLPQFCGYQPPPSVDIGPYTPAGGVVKKTQDVYNWSWNTGRYSRTVSWIITG